MLAILLHALLATPTNAINNGLARTLQMGWNNWNSLGCDVSQSLLLDTSRKPIDSGLRDLGYNYVVLDDCWSDGRDANRKLETESGQREVSKWHEMDCKRDAQLGPVVWNIVAQAR
jgi:hypothetical protein